MSPVVKRERFVVELDSGERWQESTCLWTFGGNGRRLIPNPWRHAYVRAKHFRYAAERRECLVFDGFIVEDAEDYLGDPQENHEEAHAWREAADNADWGCGGAV